MASLDHITGAPAERPLAWRFRLDGWTVGTLLIALLVATPILAVIGIAFAPSGDIWVHLVDTLLARYAGNTFLLMLGVSLGTFVIGVGTAWLVTMCRFPGARLFEWALLLPMAVPAYVIAFTYTDLLEYAGPVQQALRALFGWQSARDYWFPEIRSLGGAGAMFTLVLYPYVYLLSRAAFLEQSVCVLEISRTLGRTAWGSFLTVAVPLARPAIAIGIALALMETLNDYGTVSYFAVSTFTAGIFDVWLGMNSLPGAAQLACLLLAIIVVLVVVERLSRRRQRFHHTSSRYSPLPRLRLRPLAAALATLACLTPVALGFLMPGAVLVAFAVSGAWQTAFLGDVANSLMLAALAAALAVLTGLFMAYGVRLGASPVLRAATQFASLGYAVPGAVLAVGVIVPFAWFDNTLDRFLRDSFGVSTGLILSGTLIALTFAYVVRFLALSFGTVEAGLGKVTTSMDQAARTLGHGPFSTLRRVHLPMIRTSVLTAGLLVFVDVMKELPMTLLLRPFNFHTLATRVYEYAADELLEEAALPALAIVAAGIGPVVLLSLAIRRSRPGSGGG
ncbi:MAG: ABC transporter permease [Kiloniellales bacterium]